MAQTSSFTPLTLAYHHLGQVRANYNNKRQESTQRDVKIVINAGHPDEALFDVHWGVTSRSRNCCSLATTLSFYGSPFYQIYIGIGECIVLRRVFGNGHWHWIKTACYCNTLCRPALLTSHSCIQIQIQKYLFIFETWLVSRIDYYLWLWLRIWILIKFDVVHSWEVSVKTSNIYNYIYPLHNYVLSTWYIAQWVPYKLHQKPLRGWAALWWPASSCFLEAQRWASR